MSFTRFFNYSEVAPTEYKQKLEKSVKTYDRATDGVTYTPYVAALIQFIIGVLITVLNKLGETDNNENEYNTAITLLGACIAIMSACAGFIKYVCGSVADSARKDSEKLITLGINNGFFRTNPDLLDIGPDEKRQMFHDAQMLYVLRPKRETNVNEERTRLTPFSV